MITLDTSTLVAVLDNRDQHHARARDHLVRHPERYIVPAGILAEVAFMVERAGAHKLDLFLLDLEEGSYDLDCGLSDFPRIRFLVTRYVNLPLGFADAAVIACAERNGGRVVTFDRHDFDIVGREGTITVEP